MKKILSTILLFSMAMTFTFAAAKKEKSKNIVLDPKKKYAIEGVELGSIDWCKDDAKLTSKGELIWDKTKGDDWLHYGWELRGTDMSKYGALRIEIASFTDQEDLRIEMNNPASAGDCAFAFAKDGICYVFFSGAGRWYGNMKNPDPEEGYEIRFLAKKSAVSKTVIKSMELIKKEDIPDASNLELLGVQFGSSCYQTRIIGNEITWPKGYQDGNAGWFLDGIDLSEYDRIHIEVESNDATGLEISMSEREGKNYHSFGNSQIAPGVFEADISGEGYTYVNDDGKPFNKEEGLDIFLHTYNEKPRTKDQKTVVKSVKLLKGKRLPNENLMIEGKPFGSHGWNSTVYDGGVIEWDGKDAYAGRGWNVKGVDFSKYKKIRIELAPESADLPVYIRFAQNQGKCEKIFAPVSQTVLEAKFDGTDYEWMSDNTKWDDSIGIEEITIRLWNAKSVKPGDQTIVKSVTLLEEDDTVPQPDTLILNGAKLGSKKDINSWIDEDFAINWKKTSYVECGWRIENLEGEILEIKVSSTDTPLHLKVRDYTSGRNEAEWEDDGTHIFRINLKTKKMILPKGGNRAPRWEKMTTPFDFSNGGEIILLPANGVYKDGKKTVVEYIKVE